MQLLHTALHSQTKSDTNLQTFLTEHVERFGFDQVLYQKKHCVVTCHCCQATCVTGTTCPIKKEVRHEQNNGHVAHL